MPKSRPTTKEDRSLLHDVLYDAANAVLKRTNPCQIHAGEDGKPTCVGDRGCSTLCCGGCRHLTPTGCSIRSLSCKLWLCWEVQQTPNGKTAFIGLEALRLAAREGGINTFGIRQPKELELGGV